MSTTRFTAADDRDLDVLYADIAQADLQPLWTQNGLLPRTPPLRMRPWLWRAKALRALAERAGALVGIDRGGDRRVLALAHPDLDGRPFATHTLWGALQYLGPGELAPAHRHTPGALRFVLEGHGAWTLVDADPLRMHPGDLVLTPSMTWHEHHNDGDGPVVWFDGLDLPLVHTLDAVFFEPGPDTRTDHPADAVSAAERRYGHTGLTPVGERPRGGHSPLTVYRWADTDAALDALLGDSVDAGVAVRFSDPTAGRDIMPTLRAEMHRLRPGRRGPTTRTVGSSIWVVYRGSGHSVINGERFDWAAGDIFVVPSWAAVDHAAVEPADLFMMSDTPVLEALALARTAAETEPQNVTATFPRG
jgi:gentisate 1,2-dioxygenase